MAVTYTPATNFGAKDSLPVNDPSKVIKGSEFTTEFTAIQTAFGLAAPAASPTFTGTVTISSVDINGGTIDGVTIGGSSAGAITGTIGQFNTSLNVDGTVTADGLTVDATLATIGSGGSANQATELRLNGTSNAANGAYLRGRRDGADSFLIGDTAGAIGSGTGLINYVYGANPWTVYTNDAERLLVAGNGDISFYEDTGTTAKFFWDASAEALGIGTSSVSNTLHVQTSSSGATPFPTSPLVIERNDVNLISLLSANDTDQGILFGDAADNDIGGLFYLHASNAMTFRTNTAERMRIDSSGNVGIGTTVAADYGANLAVANTSGNSKITIAASTSGVSALAFADGTGSGAARAAGFIHLDHSSNAMQFGIADSERMRIDANGNVGLGVTPSAWDSGYRALQIGTTANFMGTVSGDGNWVSNNAIFSAGAWKYIQTAATSSLDMQSGTAPFRFRYAASGTAGNAISWSEAMRIDSSGNLLVGKTAFDDGATKGFTHYSGGGDSATFSTRSNNPPLNLNRLNSDGEILRIRKDGTTVGSIGSHNGIYTYIGTDDTALLFAGNIDAVMPFSPSASNYIDNTIDLGTSSYRFDDIYATNGTIQTSDRNEKENIRELLEAEARVAQAAKGLLRAFQWKDSVAEKGDDARIHFGIIAQDLQAAFEAEGLDAGRYAMFIHSTWTDEETGEERSRMGVRYSELLAFIIAAL